MSQINYTIPFFKKARTIQDPPLAQKLFASKWAAILWLPLRVWVGIQWVEAAMHKVTNPAWVAGGTALQGYWTSAVAIPDTGRPAISFAWYRSFLQFLLNAHAYTWFAKLIAYGELVVGVALILGAFTGIAAFAGGLMNWNYIMAGSASSNGLLFAIAVGLILAWKVSGLIGLDAFLLPAIGTPWDRDKKEPQSGKLPETAPAPAGDR